MYNIITNGILIYLAGVSIILLCMGIIFVYKDFKKWVYSQGAKIVGVYNSVHGGKPLGEMCTACILINNQYQWGSPDMVNTHITKEDIEHLSYIWDTQSKEIIDTINSRPNGCVYISQEDLRLLLNKLYDNTQELAVNTANSLDSDYN